MRVFSLVVWVLFAFPTLGATYTGRSEGVFQVLDKVAARTTRVVLSLNQRFKYGRLILVLRSCQHTGPQEVPVSAAFLEVRKVVSEISQKDTAPLIFSGWMFSHSPTVSALEDPVYDLRLLVCRGLS